MDKRTCTILVTAFVMGLTFTLVGELIMTPAENIYRSDYDEVDGLLELNEDAPELESVPEDDGQPTMQEEYQDLYGGDDYIGDMYCDVVDYPEDWC